MATAQIVLLFVLNNCQCKTNSDPLNTKYWRVFTIEGVPV